jgi:hypothetical protein
MTELVRGEKQELTERQKKTQEILDKMRRTFEEDKWSDLADRVHAVALDIMDAVEDIVEEARTEKDEVRLGRVSRSVESASKALDAVNNWRNKRYAEMVDLIKTEHAIESKTPLNATTNIIFQWQGDGRKSISPVLELLGEVVEEPKQEVKALPPAEKTQVTKPSALEVDGKSHKQSSIAKRGKK